MLTKYASNTTTCFAYNMRSSMMIADPGWSSSRSLDADSTMSLKMSSKASGDSRSYMRRMCCMNAIAFVSSLNRASHSRFMSSIMQTKNAAAFLMPIGMFFQCRFPSGVKNPVLSLDPSWTLTCQYPESRSDVIEYSHGPIAWAASSHLGIGKLNGLVMALSALYDTHSRNTYSDQCTWP